MNDYRKIIDELRSQLQSSDLSIWSESQLELITEFTQLCKSTGKRLSDCEKLLQKNLRSEAIQVAEAEPNLLDMIAALDIPERPILDEVCFAQKLPTPPALAMTTAAALENAYLELQPLDELLKTHRLLALARAPLWNRRAVLLMIADRDPSNPIWKKDQHRWETALLKQMQTKLNAANTSDDPESLISLVDSLQDGNWLVEPNAAVIKKAESIRKLCKTKQANQTFSQLQEELNLAYMAKDLSRGREIREQWRTTAASIDQSLDASIHQHVKEAFDWLDVMDVAEQTADAQASALQRVKEAMDSDLPVETIQTRWKEYIAVQPQPSKAMADRYEKLVHRRTEVRSTRKKLTWIIATVGTLAVLTIVTIIVMQVREKSKLNQAIASLKHYLEEGDLEKFKQYHEKLLLENASLTSQEEVTALYQQFRDRVNVIDRRKLILREMVDAIEKSSEEEKEPTAVKAALSQSVGMSAAEKDQIKTAVTSHTVKHSRFMERVKEELTKAVQGLSQEIAQVRVPNLTESDFASKRSKINLLKSKVNDSPLSQAEQKSLTEVLNKDEATLAQLDMKAGEKRVSDSLTSDLKQAIEQPSKPIHAYQAAITSFIQKHPTSAKANTFRKLEPTLALALKADLIGETIKEINGLPFTVSPVDAKKHHEVLQPFLKLPSTEEYDKPKKLAELMKRRAKCTKSSPVIKELDNYFKLPGISKANLLFYRPDEALSLKYYYLADEDLAKLKEQRKTTDQFPKPLKFYRELNGAFETKAFQITGIGEHGKIIEPAPQVEIAKYWQREMKQSAEEWKMDTEWRTLYLNLLDVVLQNKQIDPACKLDLLVSLLNRGSEGSIIFEEAMEPWQTFLKDTKVRKRNASQLNWSIEWIDPTLPEGDTLRKDAEEILKKFPPIKRVEVVEKMVEFERKWLKQMPAYPQAAGWLDQDAENRWRCEGDLSKCQDGAKVLIVSGETAIQWKQIGYVHKGIVKNENIPTTTLPGTPFFLLAPESTTNTGATNVR